MSFVLGQPTTGTTAFVLGQGLAKPTAAPVAETPVPTVPVIEEGFTDFDGEHGLDGAAILQYHQALSINSADFKPEKATEAGLYYGYPDCCVAHYVNAWELGIHLQKTGAGGFIPCPKCLAKAEGHAKGIGSLITNRVCARPYPNSVAAEDIKVLLQGRPSATMMKILRVHLRITSDYTEVTPETVLAEDDTIRRMPAKARQVAMDYLENVKG